MNERPTPDTERAKYERVWTHDDYRRVSPGEKGVDFAIEQMGWQKGQHILDLGCGTGRATFKLVEAGMRAIGVDTADNAPTPGVGIHFIQHCLTSPMGAFTPAPDGFCTDVMEHIPPHLVETVLRNIADACQSVFFGIAHFPDSWHGETLHLTVRPPEWWADILSNHFSTVDRLTGFNIRRDDLNSYWRCSNGPA